MMEINTTVGQFQQQAEAHHLASDTPIRVIVKPGYDEQSRLLQPGNKSVSWAFDAVSPEPGSRQASEIIMEHRGMTHDHLL